MIKIIIAVLGFFIMSTNVFSEEQNLKNNNGMIVRISEIEVYPEYMKDYLSFAREVAEVSVLEEPGVISIYPMMILKDNCQIRILEIYQNQEAYKKHIESEHFQKYKKGTLHMVKNLDLVDTCQISEKNFDRIFKKAKNSKK